ncbi:MAG: response regulator [Planctomycetota bacterium]
MILLIEDDLAHVELILRTFEESKGSPDVLHLSDGELALDYLFRRGKYGAPEKSPRPALILLDLNLPKVSGLEVLNEIKNCPELAAVPVIVLTSSEAERDVLNAYKQNANSYLVKPVNFEQFYHLIQNLNHYWMDLNYYPLEKS